jgi:hypothetical protein
MMDTGMKKNETGSWIAPLPFRNEVTHLPNSREEAFKRLKSTRKTLDRKPDMKKHYFTFMQKILDNGMLSLYLQAKWLHQSPVGSCLTLGSTIPKNPTRYGLFSTRPPKSMVFHLTNCYYLDPTLRTACWECYCVFVRTPQHSWPNIEQMFHSFVVNEEHRDFLRFLGYKGNDPDGEVIEYRMKVHLFGDTSSPAVATFGLRKTAQVEEAQFGSDAREFVEREFYVDRWA